MSIDKAKALKAAQKYLAKGQLDRAIVEFEKIVADDPKDARSLLKLGDIYTRQGDQRGAATTYKKVAAQYAEQGFFLKAMAVYKQILKLDPSDIAASESLGEMYELLSLSNDAVTTYEYVADAYARAGTPEKALKVLQRLTELDSGNVATWIRYAEMLSKTNRIDEAIDAFRRGADLLKGQDRIDDYIKVTERLLFHSHEEIERARDLARVYIDRGQGKAALPHLQTCFKANPRDPATLDLLAHAFQSLGQSAKAASVYRELARVHADGGNGVAERSVLRKLRELDPQNQDVQGRIRALDATIPDLQAADEQLEVVEMDEVELIDEEPSAAAADAPTDPKERSALVKRLMDECEVFLRYGLRDKIVAQLNRVLELDPNHIEAREKLRDTYLKRGEVDAAVQQLILLSDTVAQSDLPRSVRYLQQAAKLQPNNPVVAVRMRLSRPPPAPAQPPTPAPAADDSEQVLLVSDEPDESDFSDLASEPPTALRPNQRIVPASVDSDPEPELLLEAADEVEAGDVEVAEPSTSEVPRPHVAASEAVIPDSMLQPLGDEEQPVEQRLSEPAPELAAASEPPLEAEGAPGRQALEEAPSAADEDEEPPQAIADALEEAEFYRTQKLFDEAREVLEEARSTHGDHPALRAVLQQLEEPEEPAPAAPSRPAPGSLQPVQKVALEAASSGQAPLDVSDVLAQFKDGVKRQVDPSDAATHYDLGIAYMEMGLHAEAIDEFRLCLTSEERQRTAHTMIGLCHVARAEMQDGISHFMQALSLPGSSAQEQLDLWFELGNAHELLGDGAEALTWYRQVQAHDPGFRDVAARIERLDTPEPPAEVDEFDAMFDNMIMKD